MITSNNNIVRLFIFILVISFLSLSCVTSNKSASIRRKLVDDTISELTKAEEELKKIVMREMKEEALYLLATLDEQQKIVYGVMAREGSGPDDMMKATLKYTQERDRLKRELFEKARNYSYLLYKIRNGAKAIDALERMDVATEDAQRRLILDIFTKEAPAAVSSNTYMIEDIDPDIRLLLLQIFGESFIDSEPTSEIEININE